MYACICLEVVSLEPDSVLTGNIWYESSANSETKFWCREKKKYIIGIGGPGFPLEEIKFLCWTYYQLSFFLVASVHLHHLVVLKGDITVFEFSVNYHNTVYWFWLATTRNSFFHMWKSQTGFVLSSFDLLFVEPKKLYRPEILISQYRS